MARANLMEMDWTKMGLIFVVDNTKRQVLCTS